MPEHGDFGIVVNLETTQPPAPNPTPREQQAPGTSPCGHRMAATRVGLPWTADSGRARGAAAAWEAGYA